MNYRKPESTRPCFKPVKSRKGKNKERTRALLTFVVFLIVTGLAVFALDNEEGEIVGDSGPLNTYIEGYNYSDYGQGQVGYDYTLLDNSLSQGYDYGEAGHDYKYGYEGQHGQAPVLGDGPYYQGPEYGNGESTPNEAGYVGYAPGYIGFEPLGAPIGPYYVAGVAFPIGTGAGTVPSDGIIMTAAQLTSALNAPINASFPHTTYTRVINIGANIAMNTANHAINGGRDIWVRTYPTTAAGGTIFVLTSSGTGRHFVITASSRLTISNITLSRTVADGAVNAPTGAGGGVSVGDNGNFVMEDGATIRHNRTAGTGAAGDGGGVIVSGTNARFHMNGGTIRNNWASRDGGGVAVIGTTSRFYFNGGMIGGDHGHAPYAWHNTLTTSAAAWLPNGTGDTAANDWITAAGSWLPFRNNATRSGGGVAVFTGGTVIMNNNPTDPANPGVIAGNTGRGNWEGTGTWTSPWTSGGVGVHGLNASFYMHGGAIRGNWSAQNAGGVLVRDTQTTQRANGPSFHMYGGYIEYNRSSRSAADGLGGGGGVTLGHSSRFYMHPGASVRRNFARSTGGGFRIRDGGVLTMIGGSIEENIGGGGSSGTGGRVGVTGTSIGGGGGIFMESTTRGTADPVTLYFYSGDISYNISMDTRNNDTGGGMPTSGGGGIYLRGGDLHFRGAGHKYIDGNTSGTRGGGIVWSDTGWIHVDGRATRTGPARAQYANTGTVSISSNRAGYTYDLRNSTNVTIHPDGVTLGPQAGRQGGGIYIQGDYFRAPFFNIDGNSATGNGGGIFTRNAINLIAGSVSGNFAGGLMERLAPHPRPRPAHNPNSTIGLGGGIQISGNGGITATFGTVTRNDVNYLYGVNIDNNSAGEHGGGINMGGNGAVNFTGTTAGGLLARSSIDGNTVRSTTGNGGGLNITGSGAITFTNIFVDRNNTGQHGGGINAGGTGLVSITGTSISGNRIRNIGNGAGIRQMSATMTATDSQINNNTGAEWGGGVFIAGGSLTITNTTVNGNEAAYSGGGVYMGASNATFTMEGSSSSISGNRAFGSLITQGGGGVFIEGATGGNAAANVLSPTFVMEDGIIANNHAIRGGGVFIRGAHRTGGTGWSRGGTFRMEGGVISGNTAFCVSNLVPAYAGDPYASPPTTPVPRHFYINHNVGVTGIPRDGGDGGGVFMDGAIREGATGGLAYGSLFDMEDGYIQNNRAVRNGGGVFLDRGQGAPGTSLGANLARGSEFRMYDGYIQGNVAGYGVGNVGDGGGVFIHGSTLYSNHQINEDAVSRFYLMGGNINNNTARDGGGVFVQGGRRVGTIADGDHAGLGGRLTIGVGTGYIRGNTATRNGGGVFLGGGHREGSGNGGFADGGYLRMLGGTIGGAPPIGYTVLDNPNANRAINGGGIFAGGANDESTGTRFARSSDFNVSGGRIIYNIAEDRGGGVHLSGNILPEHTALSPTAPIFNLDFGGPGTIANNRAVRGGGVYVGGGQRTESILPSQNGIIHGAQLILSTRNFGNFGVVGPGNHARDFGGGVYVAGGDRQGGPAGGATGGILRFGPGGSVQGNTVGAEQGIGVGTAFGHGGGVALRPGRDNDAANAAEGNHPGAILTINGGSITGNTAYRSGGGLWIPNVDIINNVVPFFSDVPFGTALNTDPVSPHFWNNRNITNAGVSGNTSITENGGGIWFGHGKHVVLNNCQVVSNTALSGYGGSVFLHAGTPGGYGPNILTMRGGYLSGSARSGGGVYVQAATGAAEGAIFRMLYQNHPANTGSAPVIGNPSTGPYAAFPRGQVTYYGGGIFVEGGASAAHAGRFYMYGGAIGAFAGGQNRGSIAGRDGGGLFIGAGLHNARFYMPGTATRRIIGNDAERHGGGVFIPPNFVLNAPANTTISHNRALSGGGVWISPASTLSMVTNSAVHSNHAYQNGGGVFVSGGGALAAMSGATFTMSGGILGSAVAGEGNTANRGGGVFIQHGGAEDNNGVFTITSNGEVRGNRATFGGGVFVADGYTDGTVNVGGASLHDPYINEAPTYLNIVQTSEFTGSGGVFNMTGGTIHHNTAGTSTVTGDGGGVWVANYGYFNINNVNFSNNRAYGMGGAIFTRRHEYRNPITRTPSWAVPVERAFSNIVFQGGTNNFSYNWTPTLETPPINANIVIPTTNFGTSSPLAYNHVLNNWDINFRSEEIPISFVKFDDYINLPEYNNNPLPGAVFYLYRSDTGTMAGPWTRVMGTGSVPFVPAIVSAPVTGLVQFTVTQDLYRLVEVAVADPLVWALPAGHWYINGNFDPVQITPSNANIPTFTLGGTLANRRLDRELFEFHKTDHRLYNSPPERHHLLAGATFRIFRAPAALVTASTGLVTMTGGVVDAPWQEVFITEPNERLISTGLANQPVAFYMTRGFIYQIVEVVPPAGHQHPNVQWRTQMLALPSVGFQHPEVIGAAFPAPEFRNMDPLAGSTTRWFLGNFPDFELPLTGGIGSTNTLVYAMSGIILSGIGIAGLLILNAKRKRKTRTR